MKDLQQMYVSVDEARELIRERWADKDLRDKIEAESGELFWNEFRAEPRALLWRALPSPDNGFDSYLQRAHYIGIEPMAFEYIGDTFITLNEEKKGLGRLRVVRDGIHGTVDLIDFQSNQKKKINEVVTKTGDSLVEFHHRLLKFSQYGTLIADKTGWAKSLGKAYDFYYNYFSHFIAHGVLFESFLIDDDDAREMAFTREVVVPTIERLESKFGVSPLIVRLYPERQTDEEDFYWWSYPPHINDYLLEYAQKNDLPIRSIAKQI